MVKRVLAEMGEKTRSSWDETADLDDAILGWSHRSLAMRDRNVPPARGRSFHAAIYDSFLERLKEAVLSLRSKSRRAGHQVGPGDRSASAVEDSGIHRDREEGSPLLVEGL